MMNIIVLHEGHFSKMRMKSVRKANMKANVRQNESIKVHPKKMSKKDMHSLWLHLKYIIKTLLKLGKLIEIMQICY